MLLRVIRIKLLIEIDKKARDKRQEVHLGMLTDLLVTTRLW